jgi:prophage regulatory protein
MEQEMHSIKSLPETGFLRASQIANLPAKGDQPARIGLIPVSQATWWRGCRTGRYPKPVKLGPNISAWRIEDIRALIKSPEGPAKDAGGSQ